LRFLLFLAIFLALNLNAQESKLNIKFFGTLGGVYNDNQKYIFTKGPHSKDGSSKKINAYVDSILGTQATYKFNDNLSFITQAIVRKNDFGDIKPSIESSYLRYDSNENFIFKIGRIKLPYYKNSDNNNIGYSKLMIREPIEVYGQMPFDIYNGVEFIYSNIINKYFYTIQGSYGQEKFDIPIQTLDQVFKNEIKDLKAINFTFGNDIIEARVSYLHGKITTENQILDQIFNPLSQSLRNKYEMKDKNAEYFGLGLFIDYQNFIFSSEYGKRKVDSFYLGTSGFYTTFGYRFGSLIPYFTYAKVKMDKSTSLKTVTADNFMLNELLKIQNVAQDTKTLGFKYHINQTLDFKFEYQRIRPKGLNGGFNLNPTGNYENSNSNIYSFAIDFVF
jgi:hypothetical protein